MNEYDISNLRVNMGYSRTK